jgi:hypothetical protein
MSITELMQLRRDTLKGAMSLRQEIDQFQRTFPPMPSTPAPMPSFDWMEFERQLASLAANTTSALIVPSMVAAVRKTSALKPPEMVLRDLICMAFTVLDEDFSPEPLGEGAVM